VSPRHLFFCRSRRRTCQTEFDRVLVVAAIILWNTLELARAIEELKSEGVEMTAEQLRHLSPMDWEHIGLTGDYTWDFTAKSSRA